MKRYPYGAEVGQMLEHLSSTTHTVGTMAQTYNLKACLGYLGSAGLVRATYPDPKINKNKNIKRLSNRNVTKTLSDNVASSETLAILTDRRNVYFHQSNLWG